MDVKEVARLHFTAMANGDIGLARRIVAPVHLNRMAKEEPPACSQLGLAGFLATSAWLRYAFENLRWEDVLYLTEDEWVVAHVIMRGVHNGPFVVFPPGQAPQVFPPTGRQIEVPQTHYFLISEGLSAEHIAVRDDLRLMMQLGFIPPSPRVGLRLGIWHLTGKAGRAIQEVGELTHRAAALAADPAFRS